MCFMVMWLVHITTFEFRSIIPSRHSRRTPQIFANRIPATGMTSASKTCRQLKVSRARSTYRWLCTAPFQTHFKHNTLRNVKLSQWRICQNTQTLCFLATQATNEWPTRQQAAVRFSWHRHRSTDYRVEPTRSRTPIGRRWRCVELHVTLLTWARVSWLTLRNFQSFYVTYKWHYCAVLSRFQFASYST